MIQSEIIAFSRSLQNFQMQYAVICFSVGKNEKFIGKSLFDILNLSQTLWVDFVPDTCLIVSLVFSHLGFWSGNLFLIAPFPDLCLLVPFYISCWTKDPCKHVN